MDWDRKICFINYLDGLSFVLLFFSHFRSHFLFLFSFFLFFVSISLDAYNNRLIIT